MILGDTDLLRRHLPGLKPLIKPFREENLQPASVDLTLDNEFLTYRSNATVDLNNVTEADRATQTHLQDSYTLVPQAFVLGSTEERVAVPREMVGVVEGKSSLARLGLLVHITAGFIDPGFEGKITLEFYNCSHRPIILRAGKKICQVTFSTLLNPAAKPYGHPDLGSKYQNQTEVTASRYVG